ncbi:MAG TPA: hypothetical protein PKC39_06530, partial [Ferruginibacter sp.]|nr:hypothetical protein [Ferruginibacter sp.]
MANRFIMQANFYKTGTKMLALLLAMVMSITAIAVPIRSGNYPVTATSTNNVQLTDLSWITVNSIGSAISALNTYGVESFGTVQFEFASGYTETATSQYTIGGAGSELFANNYTAVIFKHIGTGVKPLLTASTPGTGSVDFIIRLLGADYITFDGIDLQENIANTTTNAHMEYGYYILNSASNGSQYNTIKNCKVSLFNFGSSTSQQNINSVGIYQYNTDASTTNSGNIYDSDTVTKAYNGIWLRGISGSPDFGTVISNCQIGTSTAGDIGGNVSQGSGSGVVGLQLTFQNDFSIYNNLIQNVQFFRTGNSQVCYGVWLSSTGGSNTLYNNKIIGILNKRSGAASGAPGAGLQIDGITGSSFSVYNNFIGNIQVVGSTSSTFMLYGIRIGGTGATISLYHNSIYIPNIASSQLASSAALFVTASSGTTLIAKNNILRNSAQTTSSSKVYGFYFGTGNTLVSSDNNIFDVNNNNPTGIYFTGYLTADRQTLAAWKAAPGSPDPNSVGLSVAYVSIT